MCGSKRHAASGTSSSGVPRGVAPRHPARAEFPTRYKDDRVLAGQHVQRNAVLGIFGAPPGGHFVLLTVDYHHGFALRGISQDQSGAIRLRQNAGRPGLGRITSGEVGTGAVAFFGQAHQHASLGSTKNKCGAVGRDLGRRFTGMRHDLLWERQPVSEMKQRDVKVLRQGTGAIVNNEEMPTLPPSVLATLGSSRTSGGYTPLNVATLMEQELAPSQFIISGQQSITINVVK